MIYQLILVPGAWSDKSIWFSFQEELDVDSISVTLSGLDKSIDPSLEIDLNTHINEVVDFIDTIQSNEIILVGHSYSGLVTSLAANKRPHKISALIFIEAFLPLVGKSLLEIAGLDIEAEKLAIENHHGLWPPPSKEDLLLQPHISAQNSSYLMQTMKGHPGKTVTESIQIEEGNLRDIPCFFIDGSFPEHVKSNPLFSKISYTQLQGGHWPMLTKPEELSKIIKDFLKSLSSDQEN